MLKTIEFVAGACGRRVYDIYAPMWVTEDVFTHTLPPEENSFSAPRPRGSVLTSETGFSLRPKRKKECPGAKSFVPRAEKRPNPSTHSCWKNNPRAKRGYERHACRRVA